jgi:hypothetical protein
MCQSLGQQISPLWTCFIQSLMSDLILGCAPCHALKITDLQACNVVNLFAIIFGTRTPAHNLTNKSGFLHHESCDTEEADLPAHEEPKQRECRHRQMPFSMLFNMQLLIGIKQIWFMCQLCQISTAVRLAAVSEMDSSLPSVCVQAVNPNLS